MASSSSSSSLSFPLHLQRYTQSSSSSTRLGLAGTAYRRPSPSARLQTTMQPTTTKGLKSAVTVTITAAASYEDGAAAVGHHGDNGVAATTSHPRHVADEVPPAPELRVEGGGSGALCSPKGRRPDPAPPREDGGGGKIHTAAPAPTTFAKRERGLTPPGLPAEGCGSNGGSKH